MADTRGGLTFGFVAALLAGVAACGGGGGGGEHETPTVISISITAATYPDYSPLPYDPQIKNSTWSDLAFITGDISSKDAVVNWTNSGGGSGATVPVSKRCNDVIFGGTYHCGWTWGITVPLAPGDNTISIVATGGHNGLATTSITARRLSGMPPRSVVIDVSPANGDANVVTTSLITVHLSETLRSFNFEVRDATGTLVRGRQYVGQGPTFEPTVPLASLTTYTVVFTGEDGFGAPVAARSWTFTTVPGAEHTAPTVISMAPEPGTICVPRDAAFTIRFDKLMNDSSVLTAFSLKDSNFGNVNTVGTVAGGSFGHGLVFSFQPAMPLSYSTTYTAKVTTAAMDSFGNPLRADTTWSITTIDGGLGTWTALPEPTIRARAGAKAFWTGTEMIVWGGVTAFDPPQYANDGARYNPATNTWSPISSPSVALQGPYPVAAVWTGSEMLVFGKDAGARYDPRSDRWTPITPLGAPWSDGVYSAIWVGTEALVWGSFGAARYKPATDTWSPLSVPSGLGESVWTGNRVIFWGSNGSGGYEFDPVANTLLPITTVGMPTGARAVWTGTEMFVSGGGGMTAGFYNPSTKTWRDASSCGAPSAYGGYTPLWTGTDVITWGEGRSGSRYNLGTDRWAELAVVDAPLSQAGHSVVWTATEMIVWGGYDGSRALSTGGRYRP